MMLGHCINTNERKTFSHVHEELILDNKIRFPGVLQVQHLTLRPSQAAALRSALRRSVFNVGS